MSKVIRWGVLGASKFASEQMAPAIHAARDAKLLTLATSDPAKAAPFQAFCPDLKLHESYDALLTDPDVDAVYIPLPNHLHVEWSKKAIAAGKHVLCEKPMTMEASQFDELIALRDQSGLVVAEAYMIVHHPQWQRARALVAEGAIGKLCHVDAVFAYNNAADTGNIRNRPETGGGSVPDIGVYPYGATRFVSGEEPESVTADITRENGVEVTARVTARFPGFNYMGVTSMRMALRQEITFHGDEAFMRVSAPFNAGSYGEARLEIYRGAEAVLIERFPAAAQYVNQVEAFGAAVRGEAAYPCPLEFSKGTQAMIDMVWSAE